MDTRITIRFSAAEVKDLRDEARQSGLPVSTLIKLNVRRATDRDRLALALEDENRIRRQELELRRSELRLWERQLAALGFMKSVLWEQGKAAGIDVKIKDENAREAARKLISDDQAVVE